MAFPETTGRMPRSRSPLAFKQVLGIVYIASGLGGVLAILSKFVVQPLHDQLTQDRRDYANQARQYLEGLNARIEKVISEVPSFESRRKGYVDAKTQTTSESSNQLSFGKPKAQNWSEFSAVFSSSGLLEVFDDNTIIKPSEEVMQSLQQMMYNQAFTFGPRGAEFFGSKLVNDKPLRSAITSFMKDVRSFKGALLSI